MKRFGYLLSLSLPLTAIVAFAAGRLVGAPGWMAWTPIVLSFVLLPLVDAFVGTDPHNPSEQDLTTMLADTFYRNLTLVVVPLQIASLMICGYAFISAEGGLLGQIGYLLSAGVISGSTAITTAHELIHKPSRVEQWSGGLLLSTVCYATFKPEHLFGHHRHVATPEDGSTARKDETVYRFMWRAVRDNPLRGYRLAAERVRRRGHSAWSWRNEMVWWTILSLTFATFAFFAAGPMGLCFFVGQSLIAIGLLEIINYVEHYGLMRKKDERGRYERISPRHSWNANHLMTNLFLFQLQRHSDHHANGSRRYQALRHFDESPQLPFGYATAVMVALIPPLWFAVMNPRLARRDTPLAV
ncbi:MAG: alkane 1-monooxygenase [Pseudomonadota bacterium]